VANWLEQLLERIFQAIADWVARCIPVFQPAMWNDADGIQYSNNCYNYACDMETGTFAQPGRATGHEYNAFDCVAVGNGAVSDGLRSVSCDTGCGCRDCCHQVALVIWPGQDFHWYRLDRNGRWSHKPGATEARDVDNSGNPISAPRTADRGPYTVFCGCYCVCKGEMTIN
jgi:hypothetical protein